LEQQNTGAGKRDVYGPALDCVNWLKAYFNKKISTPSPEICPNIGKQGHNAHHIGDVYGYDFVFFVLFFIMTAKR